MARVTVSASADSDRLAILEYLVAKAGYATAERYNAAFKAVLRRLADFPDSGSPRPALGVSVRIGVVYPFVVIYEHVDEVVTIFRILHGKRDITRNLLPQ
jgi:plasmid stabilization system protein ParE